MLGDSVVVVVIVVVIVRMRPQAITLAIITMRKSTHGFAFLFHVNMELHYKCKIITE